MMPNADYYINQVKTLPPAPRILPQLLDLLNQEDVDASRVVELIVIDPALTIKVIQRCNGTQFGLSTPVQDIPTAVNCLGFSEIFRIVVAVLLECSLGQPQTGYGIGEGQLWEHSLVTAIACRLLAEELGQDENLAFTAGLLHDIGKLVLNGSVENEQETIINQTSGPEAGAFLEAEKTVLGVDHAEVGGQVLVKWNFPKSLTAAVRCHHDPVSARPYEQLAAIVFVGDVIAHVLGYSQGHQAYAVRGRADVLQILEITPRDLDLLALKTATMVSEAGWLGFSKT